MLYSTACSKISWHSVTSLVSQLDPWYLIPARFEQQIETRKQKLTDIAWKCLISQYFSMLYLYEQKQITNVALMAMIL